MDFVNDRSWSCYPRGLSPSRRSFLRAIAAAAAASTSSLAAPRPSRAQDASPGDEPIPAFPPGGFPEGSVRLNFNENPLGPSPKAIRAVVDGRLGEGHRYNYIDPLIETIARHHGLDPSQVLVGCGSTEFLQFVPWALLKDGGNIVLPTPTYGWSGGVAESMGREAVRVPLAAEGRLDVPALRRAVTADTRMLYVANPNNPTGAAISLDEVRSLVAALPEGALFLVDEAYHDFLPEGESAIALVNEGAPVLVARTFSKAFGLAGLRLGYLLGTEEAIGRVRPVWWGDFGINAAALAAGPAALADTEHVRAYLQTIDSGLDQLRSGLTKLGLRPFPHRAPFFMADLGRPARPLVAALYEREIFIQEGAPWDMPTFVRVSVGTAEENETFLSAVSDIGEV